MNSATVLGRERRIDQQDEGIVVDARDRDDVARDGDSALLIKRHVDGVRGGDKEERVAVGRRARDRLQRQIAAAARPVVDDHRLAEPLRQRLADQARNDVGRAAGGNEDDQSHRPRRIGLRPGNPRYGGQRGNARCQMQKSTAGKLHDRPQTLHGAATATHWKREIAGPKNAGRLSPPVRKSRHVPLPE